MVPFSALNMNLCYIVCCLCLTFTIIDRVQSIPLSYFLRQINSTFSAPILLEQKVKTVSTGAKKLLNEDVQDIVNSIHSLDDVIEQENGNRSTICIYSPLEKQKLNIKSELTTFMDIMFECDPDEYCCDLECCSKNNGTQYD